MTDIPIIFSAPMVRALLAGDKTMTRRLAWRQVEDKLACGVIDVPSPWQRVQPGDHLWVRETWCDPESNGRVIYRADLTPSQAREDAYINRICRGLSEIAR